MFIRLTLSSKESKGAPIYVNTDKIETMRPKEGYDGHPYTEIRMDHVTVCVKETPYEIALLMKK